jgi:uncharacterized membrane protein YwaF
MYNIFFTLIGASFVAIALPHVEAGYLFTAMLVVGGFFIGHALTEALNDPKE